METVLVKDTVINVQYVQYVTIKDHGTAGGDVMLHISLSDRKQGINIEMPLAEAQQWMTGIATSYSEYIVTIEGYAINFDHMRYASIDYVADAVRLQIEFEFEALFIPMTEAEARGYLNQMI